MAKDAYKYFRIEARELLEQMGQGVLDLERGVDAGETVPRLLRLAHTLKGAARVVKQAQIADSAHRIEDALAPSRETKTAPLSAAIETVLGHLDQIGARVGELPAVADDPEAPRAARAAPDEGPRSLRADVAEMDALLEGVAQTHAQVALLRSSCDSAAAARALAQRLHAQLAPRRGRDAERPGSAGPAQALSEELQRTIGRLERDLGASTERIERELRQLRDAAEQLRLIPAATLFTTLERSARDVAQTVGKQVRFEGRGGGVRLDAPMLGAMQGALLQLVRNAVAHGIETPAERLAAGKPLDGRVSVEVLRRGRQVVFRCSDDGAGIDVAAVRRSAQRKGLLDAAATPDDAALLQLLLRGGLSTSGAVTEVAGRGIGLDVARETAERLGGALAAHTAAGQGTTLELAVPLSLASLEALLVDTGASVVAVPLDALRSTLRLSLQDIARSAQGDTLLHQGQAIPFVALSRLLGEPASPRTTRQAGPAVSTLIVEHAGALAALGVERLRAVATVMLRPLPEFAPASALVAGVSLDVDGTPQLVLDAAALVLAAQRLGSAAAEPAKAAAAVLVIDDSLTTRMLEQSILESAGYTVHLAVSGEDGLEAARRQPYALFLVDVEMPGIDGFTFIERARADPALRDVPAMLVTSRASPADRRRGAEVGAQAYIVKSEFAQAEFLERVRQLVHMR